MGGYYCDQVGLDSPAGLCHPGYYCKRFAKYATPNQTGDADVCPQGKEDMCVLLGWGRWGGRGESYIIVFSHGNCLRFIGFPKMKSHEVPAFLL